MTYKITEVSGLPKSPPAILIEKPSKKCFPPSPIANVISTEITLWEVDCNVGGYFSWSYWKSVFNMKKDYNVILSQIDPLTEESKTFLLHSSDDLEASKQAFEKVWNTLTPLVDDCTLLLTEGLLESVLIPEPMQPSMLAEHLTAVMEENPNAHPDWVKVLQALELVAIGGKDEVDGQREEDRKRRVNERNKAGKVPLHSAFHRNHPKVVEKLIQAGADLHATVNDEEGSNLFHLAAERGSAESVGTVHHRKQLFLKRECLEDPEKQKFVNALNAPNKGGFTPLMLSVRKEYVDSTVTFLQAGANPDIQHSTSGDTALHYAAEGGHVSLLKALLAFRAKTKVNNKAKRTPLDAAHASEAEGAKECAEILEEMNRLKEEAASCVSKSFEPLDVPPNSIFLLSMDGGGTRGLLLTQTLLHIQRRMKELKPDCGPVHTYFDYVVGTSAGGLCTLSLVCARASVEATRASLFKAADEICSQNPTFPHEVVSNTAQQTYGKDSVMTDIEKPRVIIPTVLADRNPPELHLICNYGVARNEQKPPNEWKVWEAGRSTSAAPFYFPPYEEKFVDGGMMSNNPTLDAMAEIVEAEEGTGRKLAMIVSIGRILQ